MADYAKIAAGLSKQQKAYLLVLAGASEPYAPRHGRTANWALRRGYARMMWLRVEDGKAVPWEYLSSERHSAELVGCVLSDEGREVIDHMAGQEVEDA